MELNRRKYNLAIVLLIAIITTVIFFSVFEQKADTSINADLAADSSADEQIQTTNDEPVPAAPAFRDGMSALKYAFEKLSNGKGYYSVSSQSVTSGIAGINVTQNICVKTWKNETAAYQTTLATCPSSYGENFYKYDYYENGSVETRKTSNTSGNFGNEEITTTSEDSYESQNGAMFYDYPFTINSNTVTVNSFLPRQNEYVIKLTLKGAAYKNYIKQIVANGVSNPRISSLTLEVHIDKTSGYLTKIIKNEAYTISRMGMDFNCTAVATQVFKVMNSSVVINKP